MDRTTVCLKTEQELKIFMDPLRQRLLRTMEILGVPTTPKHLADLMKITPSAAKHHITRLMSIGLVGEDHTEDIHGFHAVFYKALPVDVSLGLREQDFAEERSAVMENQIAGIFARLKKNLFDYAAGGCEGTQPGDCGTGVLHLTQNDLAELNGWMDSFLAEHAAPAEGTEPYECAIIITRVKETL